MKRLNIFATEEEKERINKLHKQAQNTPVMALSGAHAMRGGFSGEIWDRLKKTVHKIALSHELPEIEGYYGFDGKNGEFLKV